MEFLGAIILCVLLARVWMIIADRIGRGLGFDRLIRRLIHKA